MNGDLTSERKKHEIGALKGNHHSREPFEFANARKNQSQKIKRQNRIIVSLERKKNSKFGIQ